MDLQKYYMNKIAGDTTTVGNPIVDPVGKENTVPAVEEPIVSPIKKEEEPIVAPIKKEVSTSQENPSVTSNIPEHKYDLASAKERAKDPGYYASKGRRQHKGRYAKEWNSVNRNIYSDKFITESAMKDAGADAELLEEERWATANGLDLADINNWDDGTRRAFSKNGMNFRNNWRRENGAASADFLRSREYVTSEIPSDEAEMDSIINGGVTYDGGKVTKEQAKNLMLNSNGRLRYDSQNNNLMVNAKNTDQINEHYDRVDEQAADDRTKALRTMSGTDSLGYQAWKNVGAFVPGLGASAEALEEYEAANGRTYDRYTNGYITKEEMEQEMKNNHATHIPSATSTRGWGRYALNTGKDMAWTVGGGHVAKGITKGIKLGTKIGGKTAQKGIKYLTKIPIRVGNQFGKQLTQEGSEKLTQEIARATGEGAEGVVSFINKHFGVFGKRSAQRAIKKETAELTEQYAKHLKIGVSELTEEQLLHVSNAAAKKVLQKKLGNKFTNEAIERVGQSKGINQSIAKLSKNTGGLMDDVISSTTKGKGKIIGGKLAENFTGELLNKQTPMGEHTIVDMAMNPFDTLGTSKGRSGNRSGAAVADVVDSGVRSVKEGINSGSAGSMWGWLKGNWLLAAGGLYLGSKILGGGNNQQQNPYGAYGNPYQQQPTNGWGGWAKAALGAGAAYAAYSNRDQIGDWFQGWSNGTANEQAGNVANNGNVSKGK